MADRLAPVVDAHVVGWVGDETPVVYGREARRQLEAHDVEGLGH